MEGRPERIADYFVVVGLGRNVSQFEHFPAAAEEVDVPQSTGEPVTDIGVVLGKSETCPKGYKCINTTPGGHSANFNSGNPFGGPVYLCYRQGRDQPPITDVNVFYVNQNQRPPVGHESLAFSVGGRSADLNRLGRTPTYLTIKRGVLYGHSTAITGLCLIMPSKGEEPPPGYKLLQLELNKGLMGHSLFLCYKTNLVLPPSVPYTPELICRYPTTDYPDFGLPESVPLFCLPFGVSVEHWERHAPFPLPTFSTFALTNAQGQCMYGAVVVFYEPMSEEEYCEEMRKSLGVGGEEVLHMNKCICLLSHWPFFSAFKAFLSSLYRLSISGKIPLPLERYIGNLMLDVPFPTMERPRVQMMIGTQLIVFSLPVQTPLPFSVFTHWSLLSSLDAANCATLLSLLLLEQKIVLHSSRPALLTCVGEALRSVLFPFSWQCTYIPLCPLAFSSYMQAPVPFIIGIDSQYFDVFEKPTEVCVVDLDANLVSLSREAKALLDNRPLPSKPVRVLKQSLKTLATKVSGLNPGSDFAVEVAPLEYEGTKMDLETVDVEIREAFLRFFATIIGHYRVCLRPLLSAPSERSWDTSFLFDHHKFLKLCPKAEDPFFSYLFDTQIFTAFVEQRSFAHSESTALVFFDECTEKLKQNPRAKLLNIQADVSRRSDLPTVVALPPDESGLVKGKVYSYSTFPRLDPALFHPTQDSLTCRHPSLRTMRPGSPFVAKRTQAEKAKDKKNLESALHNDSLWSRSLLSHVCSLWYILLPSHLATHWNKMGVLSQALDLLEDMRKKQALPSDEVCYRILMEQCVKLGRPALAVRVYHEMIKAGIQPNAVTYGFYNKAVIEGKWPSRKHNWKILKIVIYACFCLRKQIERRRRGSTQRVSEADDESREPDFSSLTMTRSSSIGSRKSIIALDVGVDEDTEEEGHTLLTPLRRTPSTGQRGGSVYKLSNNLQPGVGGEHGDYVVRGDSSYMADKTPKWAELGGPPEEQKITLARGFWSSMHLGSPSSPMTRRLSRVDLQEQESPSLNVEMTSCTQCSSCKCLLYDEQIMANWSGSDADYKTSCPYCHAWLVASLTIVKKQTLPYTSDSSVGTNPTGTASPILEEDEEEQLSPPTGLAHRSKTWDRSHAREGNQGGSEKSDDGPLARPRGERLGGRGARKLAGGRGEGPFSRKPPSGASSQSKKGLIAHSATIDVSSLGQSLPAHLLGSHRTDPLHRKAKSPDTTTAVAISSGDVRTELSGNNVTPSETDVPGGMTGGGGAKDGPTNVAETTIELDHLSPSTPSSLVTTNGVTNRLGEDDTVDITVSRPAEEERGGVPSLPTPPPSQPPQVDMDHPDVAGVSRYIAQLRARGHKRSSSAPVHSQPSPMEGPVGRRKDEGGGERVATRLGKPRFHTERSAPLVVPYLSPVVLRKEVELVITQDGMRCLEREELVRERPIIYWNLVWYFTRLQLPTYLPLLTLWGFTQSRQELKKHYVQMKVHLLWDSQLGGVREPLYLMWLGKVPRPVQMHPTGLESSRRDSETQLQSLVARTQCGDLLTVLCSLLEDRQHGEPHLTNRSTYRETLFLKMVLSTGVFDIELFERDYQQQLQRLPRDRSSLLRPEDALPSPRALRCRRDFGCLHVT